MSDPLALIIEDDHFLADNYAEALRAAGFTVEIARDGRTALARIAALTPALVVLDMNLPFVSGVEILRRIRADARLGQTRVIVTTGDAQRAEALANEVDLALVKPVSMSQLSDLAARLRPPT
jgi:DNA-binding response OmpR family regulator